MKNMKRIKEFVVIPERRYCVKEAARFLNVHRCTIYVYLKKCMGFESDKSENGAHKEFTGKQLLALKEQGYPQKGGRKPYKSINSEI